LQAGLRLFLGVDDGASRCRARIRDAAGALVAEVEGPGGNMYVDFEGAIATARAQIEAVCAKAGLAAAIPSKRASRSVSASPGFRAPTTPSASRRASREWPACAPPTTR